VIVIKFGGTSVADAEAIDRAAAITRSRADRQPVVIVSALAGTTDTLLDIADKAARGQLIGALRGVEGVRERHLRVAGELLDAADPAADDLRCEVSALCDELASLAEALSVLGHATPRSRDAIAAFGEQLSTLLVVAAFHERGIAAELVDAREVMITDDRFTCAAPQPVAIAAQTRAKILPVLHAGRVPVLGGFIGATAQGITTTLGRGGSDYSAALIGAALDAEAIEIWTDVDGILTADPRVVRDASLIQRIRFDEAAELAAFGAKVLHPNTIAPAVRRGIPVYVYNSRRPEGAGTQITAAAPAGHVRAIAGKGDISVIKVNSSRMLDAHGFLRALFEVFERHSVSVDVVATSEVSVSLTVDDPARLEALVVDLAALGDVSVERHRAIIAIVGGALGGNSQTMARALQALGDIPVHMISLSATEINLTIIVHGDHLARAMRALHAAFFGAPEDS
jgi:aspartate kinase